MELVIFNRVLLSRTPFIPPITSCPSLYCVVRRDVTKKKKKKNYILGYITVLYERNRRIAISFARTVNVTIVIIHIQLLFEHKLLRKMPFPLSACLPIVYNTLFLTISLFFHRIYFPARPLLYLTCSALIRNIYTVHPHESISSQK